MLNVLTGEWQNLTRTIDLDAASGPFSLDGWVSGNQSVLLHTMENIYELGLDGRVLQRISTIALGISTSGTRALLSSDRSHLIFNRTDNSSQGPIEAIYDFDLSTNKLIRITPEGIDGSAPVWLPSEKEILFTCFPAAKDATRMGLCMIGINGMGLTTLLRDADYASYSTR